MKNILTLSMLTFREALSKRIFIFFFGVSTFIILIFGLLFTFGTVNFISTGFVDGSVTSFNNTLDNGIKMFLTYPLYVGGMFLSIFSVAGFIPSLLEKGNIDLILSKPVSRSQIILGKFFGGTAMVFVNLFYAVFMLWLLFGIKLDVWGTGFLLVPFTITLAFATIYSLIILIGIISKNTTFSLIVSFLIFFVFSPLLASESVSFIFFHNKTIKDILYYIVPQTSDLSTITLSLALGNPIENFAPVFTSILYIILILYISIFIFSKKDY